MEQKRISSRNFLLFGGLTVLSIFFLLLLGGIFKTRISFGEISKPQSAQLSLSYHNFINQSDFEVNVSQSISRTDNKIHFPHRSRHFPKRDKRFIVFNGMGVVKLVLGTSFPIQLADRVRSLSFFYNLQMQYTPFPRPVYWWSLYNTTTFPGSLRKARMTINDRMERDISRDFIFRTVEAAFESAGLPGTQCLLSMICEISRHPFHIERNIDDSESRAQRNLIHEILNAIFTPKLPNIDAKYMQAYYNGVHGAICSYNCPKHKNWLERRSIFI